MLQILEFPGNLLSGIPKFYPKKTHQERVQLGSVVGKEPGRLLAQLADLGNLGKKRTKFPIFDILTLFLCSKSCSLHPSWMQGLAPILDKTEAGRRGKGISSHSSHIPAGLEWFPPPSGIYSHRSVLKCSRFSRKKPSKIWDWGGFQETESIPIPSRDWMIQSQEGFPGFWNYWKI